MILTLPEESYCETPLNFLMIVILPVPFFFMIAIQPGSFYDCYTSFFMILGVSL